MRKHWGDPQEVGSRAHQALRLVNVTCHTSKTRGSSEPWNTSPSDTFVFFTRRLYVSVSGWGTEAPPSGYVPNHSSALLESQHASFLLEEQRASERLCAVWDAPLKLGFNPSTSPARFFHEDTEGVQVRHLVHQHYHYFHHYFSFFI